MAYFVECHETIYHHNPPIVFCWKKNLTLEYGDIIPPYTTIKRMSRF